MLLAAVRGAAATNGKQGRHDRAAAGREEEHTDDMREHRGPRGGALSRRAWISAPSIERAPKMAGQGSLGSRVLMLFPIDPEAFFVPEYRSLSI
jgi:hypothetical protein